MAVVDAVVAELAERHRLPEALRLELGACLTPSVLRGGNFTDAALAFYAEEGRRCLMGVGVAPDQGDDAPESIAADLEASIADSFDRHTQRWRRKGFNRRGGIARVPRRRAPRTTRTGPPACSSCGSKRKCWDHVPTLGEFIAWMEKVCKRREKAKKSAPTGGSLARARRAAALWDPNAPADEQGYGPGGAGHISAGVINRDTAEAFAATTRIAAESQDSMTRTRAAEWGTPNRSGYSPCAVPGAGLSCFSSESGVERRWDVVGRSFTKAEQATFLKEQCSAACGFVPISRGMPADARGGVRRIKPSSPGARTRFDCQRGAPPPLIPRLALRPLPALPGQTPSAAVGIKQCTPDVVIGVDGGLFGSGWYIVLRAGAKLLVPNPELCGQPVTRAFG